MATPQNLQCGCIILTILHHLIHGLKMTAFVMGTVVSVLSVLYNVYMSLQYNVKLQVQWFLDVTMHGIIYFCICTL